MIKLLSIIILTIIIHYLHSKTKSIENYDVKVNETTNIGKCGNICSSIYGCAGFAVSSDGTQCWLSKLPLTSPPIPSLYMSNFDSSNIHCNKLRPIASDFGISDDNYVENKVYDCYTGEKADDLGRKYFNFNVKPEDLSDSSFYFLKSDPYKLNTINWDKDTQIKVDSDFNVQVDPKKISYTQDADNEYLGKYLNSSVCQSNVSLDQCLKNCTDNSNCVGVEYLTSYNGKTNICCPKSFIKDLKPRREKYKLGSYYTKKINYANQNNKDIVYV